MKSTANYILQDSGKVEYYTPERFIRSAYAVLGRIDLDPASCAVANQTIMASKFYQQPELKVVDYIRSNFNVRGAKEPLTRNLPVMAYASPSGLEQPYYGTMFQNHPFGKGWKKCKPDCDKATCYKRGHHWDHDIPGNSEWIAGIVDAYEAGDVSQAIILCFASTSEAWFQPLMKYTQCYVHPRLNYVDGDGKVISGVTKGSVFTYLGRRRSLFNLEFSSHGSVKSLMMDSSSMDVEIGIANLDGYERLKASWTNY